MKGISPELEKELDHILNTAVTPLYQQQNTDLHVAAYLLHPDNHAVRALDVISAPNTPAPSLLPILGRVFRKYTQNHVTAMEEYMLFRTLNEYIISQRSLNHLLPKKIST